LAVLVLNGVPERMIETEPSGTYRPMVDRQQLLLTDVGDGKWTHLDLAVLGG
jgi:hypothetical protein